jgi:transcription initiation factor TFIID TATA-box-binding protein
LPPNPLDLQKLRINLPEIEFSPKVHWLKMRVRPEGSYVAFYKSGKFLVIGKSLEELNYIANKVISLLNKINITTDPWQLKVQNIVAVDKLEMEMSIENLIYALDSKKASYEPEQFPAIIYKDWDVIFLLFNSGKIVLTDVKNENNASELMNKFCNLIRKTF